MKTYFILSMVIIAHAGFAKPSSASEPTSWQDTKATINRLDADVRNHILDRVDSASSQKRNCYETELSATVDRFKEKMRDFDRTKPVSMVYRNFYASHGVYDRDEAQLEKDFSDALLDVVNDGGSCH